MKTLILVSTLLAAGAVCLACATITQTARTHAPEAAALECAKAAEGDMAIVQCFLDRGLPYPEDV